MLNYLTPAREIDYSNISTVPNVHIFKVVFLNQNDKRPARIRITSEYWRKSKIFTFGDGTRAANTPELALFYLLEFGFSVVARANHANHYLFISDVFRSDIVNPFNPQK